MNLRKLIAELSKDADPLHCRIRGNQVRVEGIDDDGYVSISSDDRACYLSLNLEFRDRDWFVGKFHTGLIECLYSYNKSGEAIVYHGYIRINDVETEHDPLFNDYCMKGEFAVFKGEVFRSQIGVNHQHIYRLHSNKLISQTYGLVQVKPAIASNTWIFTRMVRSNEITNAFDAATWCIFEGKKYFVRSCSLDKIVTITPYDVNQLMTVPIGNLEKLWIEFKGIEYFKDYAAVHEIPTNVKISHWLS